MVPSCTRPNESIVTIIQVRLFTFPLGPRDNARSFLIPAYKGYTFDPQEGGLKEVTLDFNSSACVVEPFTKAKANY